MTSAKLIPGYTTGTWAVDPVQSQLCFSVGHLGVQTVRGTLDVEGQIVVGDDPTAATNTARIDVGTVDTGSNGRDNAIRSTKLLDVVRYPVAEFRSTSLASDSGSRDPQAFLLGGDLTLRGVSRPVVLRIRVEGFFAGDGAPSLVVTGQGRFTRSDFGLVLNARPRFLDRAIARTVDVGVRLVGSLDGRLP